MYRTKYLIPRHAKIHAQCVQLEKRIMKSKIAAFNPYQARTTHVDLKETIPKEIPLVCDCGRATVRVPHNLTPFKFMKGRCDLRRYHHIA